MFKDRFKLFGITFLIVIPLAVLLFATVFVVVDSKRVVHAAPTETDTALSGSVVVLPSMMLQFQRRDLWIRAYLANDSTGFTGGHKFAAECAANAVKYFDERIKSGAL